MRLEGIVKNLTSVRKIEGDLSLDIKGIAYDSKAVRQGYLFIAFKGSRLDGRDFINDALDRGACAVVLEDVHDTHIFKKGYTYIYVKDARKAMSETSSAFFGDISKQMFLAGITGTNGKTTISYLLESLFKIRFGQSGVIGTINYRFGDRLIPAVNTTPCVVDIYSMLNSMKDSGINACILEVSSHALEQGRVDTINFDLVLFTNLTSEHMDYHKDMEGYFKAKLRLFEKVKDGGYAVINKDDPYGKRIIETLGRDNKLCLITYGIETKADVSAEDVQLSHKGLSFRIRARHPDAEILIYSYLFGIHNVYNMLAAAASGIAMGMAMDEIKSGIENVKVLPGRLESINCGQDFLVFVDYAHTENGMENVLKALRQLRPKRLLTVFGCGGNRDRLKRPLMGRISCELSDKVFITSDNPRNENPIDIINEIKSGIEKGMDNYIIELDRFNAIKSALKEAEKGDIVLVAGKGHETYQILKDTTVPFDDREVVRRILQGS